MNIYTIEEQPNSWGWYGAKDRTSYVVKINGIVWADYCYLAMATARLVELQKKNAV